MGASTADLSIKRESLISAGSNVILVVVHLVTLGILARVLESGGLGAYFFALSASFIAIIPSRELSEVMRKRVSEVDSPSAEYFGLAQAGTALYLIIFAVALAVASTTLVARTPLTEPTILAFGLYSAVLTQSAMSTRLYDAVGSPGASMVSQSIRETVFLGGVIVVAWLGMASAQSILLLGAGVHLMAALSIYVLIGIVPQRPSRDSMARSVEFGKWSAPTGVASHIWEQAPTLMMGVLLGGPAVAMFETAKRVTMVGAYLATCINDPLLVKASAMDSADDEVMRYVVLAMDYTPSIAIPALFLMAPVAAEILGIAAGPEYVTGGLVLIGVAATHVLSGLKTPISAAVHGVDQPRYVFYMAAATLVVGTPAILLGAIGGGLEGIILVLVALELAGVLVSEVAAFYAFDQFVLPETLHVQVGAALVAGGIVFAASQFVDVTSARMLGGILACGTVVHFALFALLSKSFRNGSTKTIQEIATTLGMYSRSDAS